VKIRVYVAVNDPAMRQKLAEVLQRDGDFMSVAAPEQADVVLGDHPEGGALASDLDSGDPKSTLSGRELTVLRLVAQGLSNKQIARTLGISRHTVKYHVRSVLSKLGARSRTEAVMLGLRGGLVPL
jgi:DNA-binding NarL/FixJ family response regulator